ncbi:hypothetical protein BDZ97DRAFT_1846618 [Flammula alnicola]|nr:hypothetical protein BDZ97DRAFT_1846618 [Flammula alnicola]
MRYNSFFKRARRSASHTHTAGHALDKDGALRLLILVRALRKHGPFKASPLLGFEKQFCVSSNPLATIPERYPITSMLQSQNFSRGFSTPSIDANSRLYQGAGLNASQMPPVRLELVSAIQSIGSQHSSSLKSTFPTQPLMPNTPTSSLTRLKTLTSDSTSTSSTRISDSDERRLITEELDRCSSVRKILARNLRDSLEEAQSAGDSFRTQFGSREDNTVVFIEDKRLFVRARETIRRLENS